MASRKKPDPMDGLERGAKKALGRRAATQPEGDPEGLMGVLQELQIQQMALEAKNRELVWTQRELEASRKRYFDLYETAPVGYVALDREGQFLEANLTAARLLGVEKGRLASRSLADFVVPEDWEPCYARMKRLFETGEPQEIVLRMTRAPRATFWGRLEALAAQGLGGARVCRAVLTDVTERKLALEALRESEERFRRLSEDMPVYIAAFLPGGILTYVNPALAAMAGMAQGEMLGSSFLDWLAPEERRAAMERLAALTPQNPIHTHEVEKTAPDGTRRFQRWTDRAFFDEAGRAVRYQAIGTDISDRVLAEEALRESQEKLQLCIAGADLGTWELDLTTMEGVVNERVAQILGYERGQVMNKGDWDELTHPDDLPKLIESLAAHIEGRAPAFDSEHRMRHASGEWRWINAKGRVTKRGKDGSPLRISGTNLDITERKRAEERLRRAARERERARAAEAMTRLLQGLAHEVRNPLFAIGISAAVLQKGIPAGSEMAEHVRYLAEHAGRLDSLMRDLLELGRQASPRELVECPLRDLAMEAAAAAEAKMPEVSGGVVVEAPGAPIAVRAVPARLQRVFAHLIENALRHSPPDGSVRVRLELSGGEAVVEVSDRGTGIPEKVVERVFEPFVSTHRGRRGLGLALARHYVTSMGGTIRGANNDPPPGATFTVRLPLGS